MDKTFFLLLPLLPCYFFLVFLCFWKTTGWIFTEKIYWFEFLVGKTTGWIFTEKIYWFEFL